MVDQMKTGPMRKVMSIEDMKTERKWMRRMLATQTLGKLLAWFEVWGKERYVQHSHGHDGANGKFLLHCHLQLEDARERDEEDEKVIEHVDDSRCEKERVDVDALALCGAAELRPKKAHGAAGVGHCYPDDQGVGECQEAPCQQGDFEPSFQRGEDAAEEEEDRETRAGAGGGVDECVGEEELNIPFSMVQRFHENNG